MIRTIAVLLALVTISAQAPKFISVPLPEDKELSPEIQKTLAELPPINVYRMVANVPTSFPAFIELAKSLFDEGKFNPRLREIAVLRQASRLKSEYEWYQHVSIAQSNGVTDKEIAVIQKEKIVTSLTPEENFVCRVADEMTVDGRLQDTTFQELYTRYSVEEGCELLLVISFMNLVGRYVNGTRTPIEKTDLLKGLASPLK